MEKGFVWPAYMFKRKPQESRPSAEEVMTETEIAIASDFGKNMQEFRDQHEIVLSEIQSTLPDYDALCMTEGYIDSLSYEQLETRWKVLCYLIDQFSHAEVAIEVSPNFPMPIQFIGTLLPKAKIHVPPEQMHFEAPTVAQHLNCLHSIRKSIRHVLEEQYGPM